MTEAKPSKSARKREQQALQQLGESLIGLRDETLRSLDLDDDLLAAVREAAQMRSHGALRRQKQLIGKLMRNADAEAIRRQLDSSVQGERAEKRLFAAAERWRDRLLGEDAEARDAFVATVGADAELDGLLDQLAATRDERREKALRKAIFRRLRELLERSSTEPAGGA